MDLQKLKRLAGIKDPVTHTPSVGENVSHSATEKSQYQRKHNIKPGTQEWFRLWFARPYLTGENPMPKNKK